MSGEFCVGAWAVMPAFSMGCCRLTPSLGVHLYILCFSFPGAGCRVEVPAQVIATMENVIRVAGSVLEAEKPFENQVSQTRLSDLQRYFKSDSESQKAMRAFKSRMYLYQAWLNVIKLNHSTLELCAAIIQNKPEEFSKCVVAIEDDKIMAEKYAYAVMYADGLEQAFRVNLDHVNDGYKEGIKGMEQRMDDSAKLYDEVSPAMKALLGTLLKLGE